MRIVQKVDHRGRHRADVPFIDKEPGLSIHHDIGDPCVPGRYDRQPARLRLHDGDRGALAVSVGSHKRVLHETGAPRHELSDPFVLDGAGKTHRSGHSQFLHEGPARGKENAVARHGEGGIGVPFMCEGEGSDRMQRALLLDESTNGQQPL